MKILKLFFSIYIKKFEIGKFYSSMEFIFLSSHIIFSVKMFIHIYELHVLSPNVKKNSFKDMFHFLSSSKFKKITLCPL